MPLERYRNSRSRYSCPSCGRKGQFARYIDDSGEYFDETVGRCNRESSCGYHLTPKEFLERRGVFTRSFPEQLDKMNGKNKMSRLNAVNTLNAVNKMNTLNNIEHAEQFETIDNAYLVRSLEHNEKNRFLIYLNSFIDEKLIFEMTRRYFIGGTKDGKTVWWQLDQKGRARTGKIISYSETTGKRDKRVNPSWIHYELKKHKILPETFQHQLCFFGEHLLRSHPDKPVAVVEAEKTAAIASVFLNDFIWVASCGKSYLKADKLRRFKNRKIVLFPDADGFELWEREAAEARVIGLNVTTSRMIEDAATDEEKKNGFDLADYLIRSEIEAQKNNQLADEYDAKIERIKADDDLLAFWNELVDERNAITEADEIEWDEAKRLENLRILVDYVLKTVI